MNTFTSVVIDDEALYEMVAESNLTLTIDAQYYGGDYGSQKRGRNTVTNGVANPTLPEWLKSHTPPQSIH